MPRYKDPRLKHGSFYNFLVYDNMWGIPQALFNLCFIAFVAHSYIYFSVLISAVFLTGYVYAFEKLLVDEFLNSKWPLKSIFAVVVPVVHSWA